MNPNQQCLGGVGWLCGWPRSPNCAKRGCRQLGVAERARRALGTRLGCGALRGAVGVWLPQPWRGCDHRCSRGLALVERSMREPWCGGNQVGRLSWLGPDEVTVHAEPRLKFCRDRRPMMLG